MIATSGDDVLFYETSERYRKQDDKTYIRYWKQDDKTYNTEQYIPQDDEEVIDTGHPFAKFLKQNPLPVRKKVRRPNKKRIFYCRRLQRGRRE